MNTTTPHSLGALATAAFASLFLTACSDLSKFEKSMIKGCTDSGQSKKNCTCSVEKLGETYNMKVLDEDLERLGAPIQKLQEDYGLALLSCIRKNGP
jgi:hypothetical protein